MIVCKPVVPAPRGTETVGSRELADLSPRFHDRPCLKGTEQSNRVGLLACSGSLHTHKGTQTDVCTHHTTCVCMHVCMCVYACICMNVYGLQTDYWRRYNYSVYDVCFWLMLLEKMFCVGFLEKGSSWDGLELLILLILTAPPPSAGISSLNHIPSWTVFLWGKG